MAAGQRTLLLLVAVLIAAVSVALADDAKPTILTPVANTPLGSFDGDSPAADNALDDEEAAPVGAPIGTTMTEPKPELTTTPGGGAGEAAGASAASSLAVATHIGAAAAFAAGVFAF
ncbi:uncharacterized protein LOC102710858 [Oryza brachyantha]|uniref:Uncharacterized protein n=1 Tax=Oryza brachyantha TaxID=4533 RepID=J3LUQ4_ORYBR|nr:uncharacterized protein LOC102710858 [Oryza brachyantha]